MTFLRSATTTTRILCICSRFSSLLSRPLNYISGFVLQEPLKEPLLSRIRDDDELSRLSVDMFSDILYEIVNSV